jgi:hypothetical protein
VLLRYAGRCARLRVPVLRLVLERDGALPTTRSDVDSFLTVAVPALTAQGVLLAIEDHFDVSCRVLAEAVALYSPASVGFCVDTANSLRNFEPAETVFDFLGARAYCYHLKDFRVQREQVGFRVTGAPLGEGDLDLDRILGRTLAMTRHLGSLSRTGESGRLGDGCARERCLAAKLPGHAAPSSAAYQQTNIGGRLNDIEIDCSAPGPESKT